MKSVKISKVFVQAVINKKVEILSFEPTVGTDELLGQTVSVLHDQKATAVIVPLIGYGIVNGMNTKFELGKSEDFAHMCEVANIKLIINKEESNMTTITNAGEERMTAEDWTKKLLSNAAEFVAKNGKQGAKHVMEGSTEEDAAKNLAIAVNYAGYESGKEEEAKSILATLNPLVAQAKAKGKDFMVWLGAMALVIWKKISAAAVGLGYFTYHTVGILANHAFNAGRDIAQCFSDDVIDRVKKA